MSKSTKLEAPLTNWRLQKGSVSIEKYLRLFCWTFSLKILELIKDYIFWLGWFNSPSLLTTIQDIFFFSPKIFFDCSKRKAYVSAVSEYFWNIISTNYLWRWVHFVQVQITSSIQALDQATAFNTLSPTCVVELSSGRLEDIHGRRPYRTTTLR